MTDANPTLDAGALYRVLAESAQDAILTIDEQSMVLSINPAGARMFGLPADAILGRPMSLFMPERYRAAHHAGFARYLASGTRHIPWRGVQLPILTAAGDEVPVEISFGEFISNGKRIFSGILRDISERVASQAALAANVELLQTQATELEQQVEEAQVISEELEQTNEELQFANAALAAARSRIEEVLNSTTDAVSVFDSEWRWTYVNPAARAVLATLGRDPDAVLGKVLWEVLPELLGTPFEHETRRAAQSKALVTFEEYHAPLGRWFEMRIVPSPGGITTFTRDITEQRQATEVLQRREEESMALANSIPTLAWMANPDGWIFWYNDRWYEYTGTTTADMEGWGWQSVHHPDTLPEVLELWTKSIRTGEPFEMTFPLRGADGSFRPFLTRVFPMRGSDGAVVRWFGTNTDVHHEHQARQAAELSATRIRQLQSLTALLARARTLEDVASAVIGEATAATHAYTGMLSICSANGDEVIMLGETGLPAALKDSYRRFPIDRDTPSAEAIRTGIPIFIGQPDGETGLHARYPSLTTVWEMVGGSALASIPLVLGERVTGAMSFTYQEPQAFHDEQREFLLALGVQAAQAIDRVHAFEAERRERRRSESIVESITDGFTTFDADLRFTYVNARAATMFGVAREDLLGRSIHSLARAEESPFVELIRGVAAQRREQSLEGYGTIMGRWLDLRAYPAEDGGVIAYFQDFTDRRRQQEASSFLAEASRVLSSSSDYEATLANLARVSIPRLGDWCAVDLLEPSGDGAPRLQRVALVHDDATKLALAEEYRRRYPSDLGESSTDGIVRALGGEPVLVPEMDDAMLAAAISDPEQLAMLRQLGLASVMIVPLAVGAEVLGTITFCGGKDNRRYDDADLRLAIDLAGRAATAVEHGRLLARAESANAAKTEFLRTVSHELRQPLNAMGGLLQLWELGLRGDLTEQQHKDLERIKRNQQQLTTLIEDLLSFARLEAGKLSIQRTPTTVHAVLDGLSVAVSFELEAKGIAYDCRLPDDEIAVLADADRLHQVLVNLVTNAIRASENGDRIEIWTEASEDTVHIHVCDTGVGIPEDKLQAIFVPFVQVGRSLNKPREGAGLGLAISQELVAAMDGTLTVKSVLGEGSTFTVTLARSKG